MKLGNASPLPPDDDRPPLPEGWVWTTIGEACYVERGITFPSSAKSSENENDTIACLRTANVQEVVDWQDLIYVPKSYVKNEEKLLRQNDILISMANSVELVGKVSFVSKVEEESSFGAFIAAIRTLEHFAPKFLFYYLRTSEMMERMRNASSQTVNIANLSLGRLIPLPVICAPLPEQHRIVDAIETQFTRLDAAVAALHRVKANLARYKASVLKAACEGRLVPTDAKLYRVRRRGEATPQASIYAQMCEDARKGEATPQPSTYAQMREDTETPDPEEPGGGCLAPTDTDTGAAAYEPADVLLRRILAERRARWMAENPGKRYVEPSGPDTSGLPELPEGWCWATVEQLTILSQNGTGKRRSGIGNPTIVLRLADIVGGEAISLDDVRRIKLQDDEIEKYKLVEDDLLCIRVNGSPDLVGRVIHFTGSDEAIAFCDHFIRFRLALAELADFLTMNFHTDRIRKYIDLNKVSSAGQNTVSQTTMNAVTIPLPPLAEQHRIVAEVERRLSVVAEVEAAVEANLARAARLRQAILREAFAGRLVPRGDSDTGGVGVV